MFEVQLLDARGMPLAEDDKWMQLSNVITFHGGDRPVRFTGTGVTLRIRTGVVSPGPYLLGNYHLDVPAYGLIDGSLDLTVGCTVNFGGLKVTLQPYWMQILGLKDNGPWTVE